MEEQKQSTSSNYFKGLSRRDYIQKAHEIIQQEGSRENQVQTYTTALKGVECLRRHHVHGFLDRFIIERISSFHLPHDSHIHISASPIVPAMSGQHVTRRLQVFRHRFRYLFQQIIVQTIPCHGDLLSI